LGYIINANGVEMSTRIVEAIWLWETPRNLKDVQRFLGFVNFYRRFIKNFSGVAQPITDLTRNKGLDFHWGPLQVVAFQQLKDVFTSTPILKHCDPALEVIIETNASNFTIGCILSQKHTGWLHLVAFHSRKIEPVEKNYNIHNKELLAVVEAFKHWRPYCHGACFLILVFMDHQNLRYFTTSKVLNQCQVHWAQNFLSLTFGSFTELVPRMGNQIPSADVRSTPWGVGGTYYND
jgi:hypothetical protein